MTTDEPYTIVLKKGETAVIITDHKELDSFEVTCAHNFQDVSQEDCLYYHTLARGLGALAVHQIEMVFAMGARTYADDNFKTQAIDDDGKAVDVKNEDILNMLPPEDLSDMEPEGNA